MQQSILDDAGKELQTLSDMVRFATSYFGASEIYYGHGSDNPLDEALQLILPTLNLPFPLPSELFHSCLLNSERQQLLYLIDKRVTERIPVPYLTHKAWFAGHEFYVDERVLIPRSPLAELINQRFSTLLQTSPSLILDLCCGSGCIAIACAYAFPDAQIDAVDLSEDALQVTEYNISQHQLADQVTPICSDLFNELLAVDYDVIITNPPYVDEDDMSDLPEEYQLEPEFALAAGKDGLDLVRRILASAAHYLSEQGVLICEVGNSMMHLMEKYPQVPFKWLSFKQGGDGVFMLTKSQLLANKHYFK